MSDILKRLEALGVTKGLPQQLKTKPREKNGKDLFKVLEASFPCGIIGENDYGRYFVNRLRTPLSQSHGCVDMSRVIAPSPLFDSIMGFPGIRREETLAMDTETSGLSNGAGAFVFMIGMGYFKEDEYIVDQLILPDLSDEPAFIRQIELTFADYKTLLTYNGKGFDIPMIRSRGSFHLFPDFCARIDHVDLLYISRKYWKRRLGSVRLSNIENYVLKLQRGEMETPGSLAPDLYRNYLQDENAELLTGVAYHNHIDVLSLSAYMLYLNDLCIRSANGLDIWEQEGVYVPDLIRNNPGVLEPGTLATYKSLTGKDKKEIARLYLKEKRYEKAADLLMECAEAGDTESALKALELFRKKLKDPQKEDAALCHARELIEQDPTLGPWKRQDLLNRLEGK